MLEFKGQQLQQYRSSILIGKSLNAYEHLMKTISSKYDEVSDDAKLKEVELEFEKMTTYKGRSIKKWQEVKSKIETKKRHILNAEHHQKLISQGLKKIGNAWG